MGCSNKITCLIVFVLITFGCSRKNKYSCQSRVEYWGAYSYSVIDNEFVSLGEIVDTICNDSLRIFKPVSFTRINEKLKKNNTEFYFDDQIINVRSADSVTINKENYCIYELMVADLSLEFVYPFTIYYVNHYGVVGKYDGGMKYYFLNKVLVNNKFVELDLLPYFESKLLRLHRGK